MGQVTIYNRGRSTFHAKSGTIEPGKSITVDEVEAKSLAGYPDLVDASKMGIGNAPVAQIESFKTEINKLKDEVTRLTGENVRLEAELHEAKDELADANDQLGKLTAKTDDKETHHESGSSKGKGAKAKGRK